MPTPATIAGLVMGAVLGAGLLCLGAYAVHRYMGWRCRELVDLFQRSAVRVVTVEDLECNKKSRELRSDEEQGRHMSGMKQALERPQDRSKAGGTQEMMALRGGFEYGGLENGPSREHIREMQSYVPRPAHVRAQPTTHHSALGWHKSGGTYDHLWQAPAAFQQADLQGGYHAYIIPHPMAYEQPHRSHLSSNNEVGGQPERNRARAGKAHKAIKPISFEGDSVVVADEHPFVMEGLMYVDGKKDRITRNKCNRAESRQSSSTALGTCPSDGSWTSTENIPRDRNPGGALRRTQAPLPDPASCRKHPQRIARDGGSESPNPPQLHRRSKRQEREAGGSVRSGSVWVPKFDGRLQAGSRSASKVRIRKRGRSAVYGAASKSGFKGAASEQRSITLVHPRSRNHKSAPSGPPTSAFHNTRLTRITDSRIQQGPMEQAASVTGTVGSMEETRPHIGVAVTVPTSDTESV